MFDVKQFRVAKVTLNPEGGDLYSHLMISQDGECWDVARSRTFDVEELAFNQGDIIDVPIREVGGKMILDWLSLSCEGIRLIELADTYMAVERCWGTEVAEENKDNFPPKTAVGEAAKRAVRKTTAKPKAKPKAKGPFVPEHFRACDTGNLVEKAAFANNYCTLAAAGFDPKKVTKVFYNRLCRLFGLTDEGGYDPFLSKHFSTAQGRLAFVKHIVGQTPVGDPTHSWVDVEANLKAYTAQKILPRFTKTAKTQEAMAKRNLCRSLIEDGYMPEQFALPWQRNTKSQEA